MNSRRFGGSLVTMLVIVLAFGLQPASAASALIADRGFEVPKVPGAGFANFPTGSTLGTCGLAMPGSPGYQFGCWRVFAGNVDVAGAGLWRAKAGKQSLELNGTTSGAVLQAYPAQPNRVYKMRFSLAGDPLLAGTVSLLAVEEQFDVNGNYITGATIGSYSFDTTGHSASSMGYVTKTGFFDTGATTQYVDVELQSTTNDNRDPSWGPVVDQVSVADHGPAPQVRD